MEKVPFALFDDHVFRAHALKRLLLSIAPLKFLFKVSASDALLLSLKTQSPSLLFISYPFTFNSSFNLIEKIREYNQVIKIVILLSLNINSETVLELIDEGANAILSPSLNPREIENILATIMMTPYYYNDLFSKAMHSELKKRGALKNNRFIEEELSEQEIKIMNYLYDELTHKEIGDKMTLGAKTIDTYTTRAIHKVGAKNVIGLIKYGLKNKLIKHPDT